MTRGQRNIAWIERNCRAPEGKLVGQPVILRPWQKKIIRGIYDSLTRTAIISFGRKNGKTSLAACILLLHLCGPEARANSQLCSAAQSKDQAALLMDYATKMARMSPDLREVLTIRDTVKEIDCPEIGTSYKALSADVATNLGKSPVFIVHDELGQVRGPRSALYEALETATGAHDDPLSVIISTQATTDADLLSVLIDDAKTGADKTVKVWLWTAPKDMDPFSRAAKLKANPAYGDFLSAKEVDKQANDAKRMPSAEAGYRNLILNQRVEARSPFVSPGIWAANGGAAPESIEGMDVYLGLDLAAVRDLTALIGIVPSAEKWGVFSTFWLPSVGLAEKAKFDRVPYDLWANQGFLETTPGSSIEYEFVAEHLRGLFDRCNVKSVAFDRWGMKFLRPWLEKVGFSEEELERFVEFGQGYQSMSPALRELESMLLNSRLEHGMHPVLTMCAANARVESKDGINRKFVKATQTARIDGMVALAMAVSVAAASVDTGISFWEQAAA